MNFDDAIKAHASWKQKLANYLVKPDGSIDVATLATDNRCTLGQWIHQEAAKYVSDGLFAELRREHADFHRAAADLVRRADAGERVSQEAALGAKSFYGKCSSRVVQLIMDMRRRTPAAMVR